MPGGLNRILVALRPPTELSGGSEVRRDNVSNRVKIN
jgi:hypothetical protein